MNGIVDRGAITDPHPEEALLGAVSKDAPRRPNRRGAKYQCLADNTDTKLSALSPIFQGNISKTAIDD